MPEQPAPLSDSSSAEVYRWLGANVRADDQWRLLDTSNQGVVLAGRDARENVQTGRVTGRLRLESSRPRQTHLGVWRSAIATIEGNCLAGIVINESSYEWSPDGRTLYVTDNMVGRPDLPVGERPGLRVHWALHQGQNLTGATVGSPDREDLLLGLAMNHVGKICQLAFAEEQDADQQGQDIAPLLQRDPSSIERWASNLGFNLRQWEDPVYSGTAASWLSKTSYRAGREIAVEMRIELVNPVLASPPNSRTGNSRTVTVEGKSQKIAMDLRPVWVRSERRAFVVDCLTLTTNPGQRDQFGGHELRRLVAQGAIYATENVGTAHIGGERFRGLCTRTAGTRR